MGTESWRPVPGYEGLYSVSNLGRVRREAGWVTQPGKSSYWRPERAIRVYCDDKGRAGNARYCFSASRDGKVSNLKIHQVVMEAFCGGVPKGFRIRFKDGNSANAALDNLSFDAHGAKRIDGPTAALIARTRGKLKYIGALYGIDQSTVSLIKRGRIHSRATGIRNPKANLGARHEIAL